MKNLFALAAILVLFSASAFAQSNATATASAEARIVAGIALTSVEDMSFGQIVRSATAGDVILDVNGDRTAQGGVTLGQNGGSKAAEFEATGEDGYTYAVTLPSSITLTRNGGSETMSVDDFTSSVSTYILNGGAQSFSIGATLRVGANQATGLYNGSFDVTAAYN